MYVKPSLPNGTFFGPMRGIAWVWLALPEFPSFHGLMPRNPRTDYISMVLIGCYLVLEACEKKSLQSTLRA